MKNLQFLFNFGETLPKVPINELVNWSKFGQDWTKIVEFLLIAHFMPVSFFMNQSLLRNVFNTGTYVLSWQKVSTFHLAYSTLYLCILPSGSFRLLFSSLINPFF